MPGVDRSIGDKARPLKAETPAASTGSVTATVVVSV
jgi:hypothetical protein